MNNCCSVEAIVTIDERGQIVIPKDLRTRFKLEPGEKLALISCVTRDTDCCITLIKTDKLGSMIQEVLGPAFKEIASSGPK